MTPAGPTPTSDAAPAAEPTAPIKTYSDKPSAPQPTPAEGWKKSGREHVDPDAAEPAGQPANEPTPASGASLNLRPIPAPATSQTT